MKVGFTGLYESYLDAERKLRAYRKRQRLRPVPVGRVEMDESDFERTISVTAYGSVFYIDHVLLGVIRRGRFVGNRWSYKVVSMAGVRKIKLYLEQKNMLHGFT